MHTKGFKKTLSIILALMMLLTSLSALSASADEIEAEPSISVGAYVTVKEDAVNASNSLALEDWCYRTVFQLARYEETDAVLNLGGNEVVKVSSDMLTVSEKASYSDITLGDKVKLNRGTSDLSGNPLLYTECLLTYIVTSINGNVVEVSNSSIQMFGFTYHVTKKMDITDLSFQANCAPSASEAINGEVEVGTIVAIKKGAKAYDGSNIYQILYYLTFRVTAVDGDKVTIAKELSAVGFKYSVKEVVNIADLTLVSPVYKNVEVGSMVNIKEGAKDYYGNQLNTAYSYIIFRVVSIENDKVLISSTVNVSAVSYTLTKTVNINNVVLTTGDVSFDPAIKFILEKFDIDSKIIYGDATGSGSVGMVDVVTIQQILAHFFDFNSEDGRISSDVNGDGKVDMKDIILIEQRIAGIISTYPIEISKIFS